MTIGLYIYSLAFGGAERVVSRLSYILAAHGHSVYVILDDLSNVRYECAGKIISLAVPHNRHGILSIVDVKKRIRKLRQYKNEYAFDAVISFLIWPNLINVLSRRKHCKTFVSIRNRFLSDDRSSFFQKLPYKLAQLLYKKANGVICVSELVRQEAVSHLYVRNEKSVVLYNPYDAEQLLLKSQEPMDERITIFLSNPCFTFVTTGRHTHQKGFWHLIKAFSLVHKEFSQTRLVMIGDGEQHNAICKLIADMNLADCVLLTGTQPNVFNIEKACDVYVLSSLFEGFPNALVEAMCLGLPVLATDCKSGPREILAPDTDIHTTTDCVEQVAYGILVPELESEENWDASIVTNAEKVLADGMKLLLDAAVRKRYAIASAERAKDFSSDVCYEQLMNIIEKQ